MEFFFGLTENDIETKKDISLESSNKFTKLEPLPSINLEEQNQVTLKSDTPTKDDNNEYLNFIPTDIRLVETSVPKENESKGKIASIGKLLVNNRDIESIIESNATSASSQSDEAMLNGKTSILSLNSGEEIYEKFNKLKQEFEHIREIALVDKGGFVLASNYEDKTKIHITGALIAGAYHTMQNYLTQISFKHPKRIFFETENSNNFIMKTDDNFLFSIWDKGLKHIDYSDLEGFIENAEISEKELIPLIELNQIKNFSISDITGEIIKSNYNFENSEKLALISSALFENLKVFLININLLKLTRITILNDEEVITIQKINEKIASFVTPTDGLVKISENFQKIEEIY